MTMRAGLFRAWAVGTVIWVGAVAFIGLQAIAQTVASSKYIYVPGDSSRYQVYTPRPEIDDGRVVTMMDGSELYFHRSIWEYNDAQDIRAIAEDFWEQRWIRYWILLRPWLLLVAIPGFIFIIVYALLWVFDGFTTTTA
jgi:hypothetical protein